MMLIWIYILMAVYGVGGRKSIILLAGQSNMSGRGGVHNGTWDGVVPPECHPNPLISLLNATTLQWEEAHEPLHKGVDNLTGTVGVGPGMPFAAVKLGGCLRGLLWYQGENDCNSADAAKLYKARFQQFVLDLRSDLGSPLLPVVEVAIATGGKPELREVVREGQFESAGELARMRCVDAKGLERKPDDMVHLTTEAQVKLGREMADAFLSICLPLPCL